MYCTHFAGDGRGQEQRSPGTSGSEREAVAGIEESRPTNRRICRVLWTRYDATGELKCYALFIWSVLETVHVTEEGMKLMSSFLMFMSDMKVGSINYHLLLLYVQQKWTMCLLLCFLRKYGRGILKRHLWFISLLCLPFSLSFPVCYWCQNSAEKNSGYWGFNCLHQQRGSTLQMGPNRLPRARRDEGNCWALSEAFQRASEMAACKEEVWESCSLIKFITLLLFHSKPSWLFLLWHTKADILRILMFVLFPAYTMEVNGLQCLLPTCFKGSYFVSACYR